MDDRNGNDALEELHEETFERFLPVIVIMGILCVLGIVGNAFTIGFYGFVTRKTPTVLLITALAIVDLIVTILIIPNLAEMGVNVKYTNPAACKIMHFFGHWAIETSALTLWFIAIDRYRHVCCPFKKQVSFVAAKRAVIIITVVSFLISVRDFANFDIIEFPVHSNGDNSSDVFGHLCTTRDDSSYKVSVTLFHSIDALTVVMILVTLFVTYGQIIWTIKKGGFALASDYKETASPEPTMTEEATNDTSDGRINDDEKTRNLQQNETSAKEHHDKKDVANDKNVVKPTALSKTKRIERSITLMMLAVSIVFCVCFVPYFVVKIGIRSYKKASQLELGAGIQLALRLTYVNSFANPYIFCIFNPQLRRFVLGTMLRRKSDSRKK